MSETFFKRGDQVDVRTHPKDRGFAENAGEIVDVFEGYVVSLNNGITMPFHKSELRKHVPMPELGSEVRWKGWTDLDPNATVDFCLLVNAFDHGAIRLWTVGYKIPGEGVVRYMTAPASEFEVVQE